jgi:vacuolar protein sorting-associated protein 13A/C
VGNIGQGFLEGGKTFGEGLLKGVTGIVADPLAGAKQGGVLGFMTGTVRGIVGVPGQIIGGALSAASKVTEGMDATYKEVKGQLTAVDQRIVQRRRLPRCIRGEGILAPYSVVPAMGLALLYNCGAGSVDSLVKGATGNFLRSSTKVAGKEGLTDSYETHMTLPNGNIAIITNMRLLMVQAEMFAQLETEVEMGRRQRVSGVPPGRLLWQLTWDQMLSAELAYHRQQPGAPPDGVIVHRKNRSEDGDVLVHDVRCNPNNNQALRLYEALSAARQKYYIQPRREAVGWKVTPVIAAEQQGNQEMPSVMLSMDFKRVWRCSRPGARPLSVWRPVGPPGYASLGDVAMPGNEPPARPVSMYRDTAQEAVSRGHTEGLAAVPALAQPERYQLVFRDSGSSAGGNNSAMSLWRPIAPNGYMEIGYVVVPAIEEPPLGIVRCMRSDLVKQARLFDYPVWSDTSSDNMYWLCSIWQVDNSCSTFVAAKSTNKPHQHTARAPSY